MKLQTKFSILMLGIFCVFMAAFWVVTQYWTARINAEWASRFTEAQVTSDMQRTLHPLLREIRLAKQMALEPALIQMALHENEPKYRQRGIALLESYRTQFQSQRYFAAFSQSQHYFWNDGANQANNNLLRYTLSSNNPSDAWFYKAMVSPQTYALNVDLDAHLKLETQVWINHLIKQDGKTIGVVGTGISLKKFEQEIAALAQQGIHTLWVDRALRIQLHLIPDAHEKGDSLSLGGQSIEALLLRSKDNQQLREMAQRLIRTGEKSATARVQYQGTSHLLGVRYVPELDWFALTMIDAVEGQQLKEAFLLFIVFGVLFLLGLLVGWINLNRWVLSPLMRLQHNMVVVELNNSLPPLGITGTGEVAQLSRRFEKMANHIRDYQVNLEAKVLARTRDLDATLAAIPDALFEIDSWGMRQKIESNYSSDLFVTPDVSLGESLFDLLPAAAVAVLKAALHEAQKTGLSRGHQFALQVGAVIRWFELSVSLKPHLEGEEDRFIVLAHDVSALKLAEEQIRSLANIDALTQLPNRRMLNDRLKQTMEASKRSGHFGAMLFLDLDNFKPLNDTHGHEVGDQLLIEVARRLISCVRAVDTVARFGGDEFVVVLQVLSQDIAQSTAQARQVAEKIRLTLSQPYYLTVSAEGQVSRVVTHSCGSSIGITLISPQQMCEEAIFKQADSAMYQAKQQGRNRVCVHAADIKMPAPM